MNDEKPENGSEIAKALREQMVPRYRKMNQPVQIEIDRMFWMGKKLTLYLIDTQPEKIEEFPEYHICVERRDATVDDEPLFSIIETKKFKLVKVLWLKLQRLKECLANGTED